MKTMPLVSFVFGSALLLASCAAPGLGQGNDEIQALKKEVQALREGQKAIQKDLDEIKKLLRSAQGPQAKQDIVLSVEGAPFMGDPKAKLTLIEFSDYQCPFCARHVSQTLPQLVTDYVRTGKVKYVLRDFPLENMHPAALKAAEAARCAGEQGKYWAMHDRLITNPRNVDPKGLSAHAKAVGLDVAAFDKCVESGKYAAKVRQDLNDGQEAGVSGTPTFFLGPTDPSSSKVKVAETLVGAQPYSKFKETIDGMLSK